MDAKKVQLTFLFVCAIITAAAGLDANSGCTAEKGAKVLLMHAYNMTIVPHALYVYDILFTTAEIAPYRKFVINNAMHLKLTINFISSVFTSIESIFCSL